MYLFKCILSQLQFINIITLIVSIHFRDQGRVVARYKINMF